MDRKIGRTVLLLLLACILAVPGCRRDTREEAHLRALAEVSESGRQYQEKRRRFLKSPLCEEGIEYLKETLGELFPGGEITVVIEPGDWIDAEAGELKASLDSDEARLVFFAKADAVMQVNFWDFGTDGKTLALELIARGISGRLMDDKYASAEWILDALNDELGYYVRPGV